MNSFADVGIDIPQTATGPEVPTTCPQCSGRFSWAALRGDATLRDRFDSTMLHLSVIANVIALALLFIHVEVTGIMAAAATPVCLCLAMMSLARALPGNERRTLALVTMALFLTAMAVSVRAMAPIL